MASGEPPFREISAQEFLAGVRANLGLTAPRPAPSHPEERRGLEEQRRWAEAINQRLSERRAELVQRLAQMGETSGWKVLRAASDEEAGRTVLDLVAELEAKRVALTAHPVLERLGLAQRLRETGVSATVATGIDTGERRALRHEAAAADLGISGVDYAVAETGSCVLLPRRGVSRVVGLLPPVHLAIVDGWQVVETLEDLIALRRLAFLEGSGLSSYMGIVTGPSRTADIEQTIVIGVHGPRQVHMLIVDPAASLSRPGIASSSD